jgi:ABC-type glycerol-3-phosphate transport system permease component
MSAPELTGGNLIPRTAAQAQPRAAVPHHLRAGLVRYVVGRGWLHLTLMSGAGIFLLPFLWLVATSMRTDEEMVDASLLPRIPRFVASSPYVRPPRAIEKPLDVPQDAWDEALPTLLMAARSACRSASESMHLGGIDRENLVEAAATAVVNDITSKLDRALWRDSPDAVVARFRAMLAPPLAAVKIDERIARLELRSLQVRSLDAHIVNISDPDQILAQWQVESGNASIERAPGGAVVLRYAFESGSDQPIVLRHEFDMPFDPQQFYRLFISIRGDDSWHGLCARLEMNGSTWEETRPMYVAQHRPVSAIFQPPGADDHTYRPRRWIPLERTGAATVDPRHPRRATLRVILEPSSTAEAIAAKVMRNYRRAFDEVPFGRYLLNSLLLVVLITAGTLFSATFVAYAFARLSWPGRSVAFVILLATMMLPGEVTMIPSFLIWRQLGWYNTLNPLWVPAWLGGAFFIFLMTQHMRTIPRELEEAARLDGLNAVQTWWYIIVPQVKPAAAAIAILTIMAAWNEFMGPLIYLRDQSRFPLSLGLFAMRIDSGAEFGNDWSLFMAGNVLMTLPMVLVFAVFQRHFIQGMTLSGMK